MFQSKNKEILKNKINISCEKPVLITGPGKISTFFLSIKKIFEFSIRKFGNKSRISIDLYGNSQFYL